MLWNSLIKKPVLVLGVLMMGIFLYDYFNRSETERGILRFRKEFIVSSCSGVIGSLKTKVPDNWKLKCENENLAITIQKEQSFNDTNELKTYLYRELANSLSFISKNAAEESLAKILIIRLEIFHRNLRINAVTEGQYLVKLKNLRDPNFIRDHLQATVNVKEF
jgi:hypothetical protein